MRLPEALQSAIDSMVEAARLEKLIEARIKLTDRYRQGKHFQFMTNEIERLAYIVARMPATFSALSKVFSAIPIPIQTLLDLGSGPGTGIWAAHESFSIISATLLEKDAELIKIGQRLIDLASPQAWPAVQWVNADLEIISSLPRHDAVLLSYSIGELNPARISPLLDLCWEAANQVLIIVEPGTPVGFERIRSFRHSLIKKGAHIIAPCTHNNECPMVGNDWCHFSAHVERSFIHQKLKQGTLSYEDEKFSYLVASKTPLVLASGRLLSEPIRHGGHMQLNLCTADGLSTSIISKKMGETYKKAKKASWGDSLV